MLVVYLLIAIVFIVVSTTKFKLHPFLALIFAALGYGLLSGMEFSDIVASVNNGFGNIVGYIGIVIIIGCIIGTFLEESGGAYIMPSISSCSIVVYSEGAPETGNGSLARFDLSTDEIFQEYGYFPVGTFSIGEQFDALFSTGESFDDPGTNYYPSEGTLTISGSRRGSCSIEFSGVTSSGIELTAEYKGKIHNAYEDE